ncbi:hypothetical protein CROQUDRAFT_659542 [Cronartium quercuum f. sp. fusiforme G11]|uniref:Autophagy-related protein 27 n=1 Tax=Cronartium quercuum f. sp. fusiforme G11 TaxID=708437 RepID=A0A9P6NJL7_9BASI|nr:hypothetical protein CROQUDRAFT_659542 [Cronartium quercuum f. sp. fusiforme G11]
MEFSRIMKTSNPRPLTFTFFSILSIIPSARSGALQSNGTRSELVDCKYNAPDGAHYDFTSLIAPPTWPLNVTTSRPTPPTLTIETLLISLCTALKPVEDGCPVGTTVCLSIFNEPADKGGADRRLISRIPLAGPSRAMVEGGGHINRDPVRITATGGTYNGVQQLVVFNLACATSAAAPRQPKTQYDSLKGLLTIEWPTPLACASKADSSPVNPSTGSGWFGSFITFVTVAFIGYFLVGIWINYNKYGGSGWDLVPHQDFWRDLPRMILDLFCAKTGRGQASRAGYSAL